MVGEYELVKRSMLYCLHFRALVLYYYYFLCLKKFLKYSVHSAVLCKLDAQYFGDHTGQYQHLPSLGKYTRGKLLGYIFGLFSTNI